MINVICVKWGDKFTHEFVNRLFTMVKRNLTVPFTFYCYTDNPSNIREEVQIINIEEEFDVWWNKLAMFKTGFVPPGPCLFFDMDVVIQKNIDFILDYLDPEKLTMIKSYWKYFDPEEYGPNCKKRKNRYNTLKNSSVLLWNSDFLNHIWEHFYEDPDWYQLKYQGIDRFLEHEQFDVNYFPKGFIYSRLYGVDLEIGKAGPRTISVDGPITKHNFYYEPDYAICIFNGYGKQINGYEGVHLDDNSYIGYEQYWS